MVTVVGEQPPWQKLVLWAIRGYGNRTDFEDLAQECMLAACISARKHAAGLLGRCTLNQAVVKSARWAAREYTRTRMGGARCREVPTLSLDQLREDVWDDGDNWEPAAPDIAPELIEREWLRTQLPHLKPQQAEIMQRRAAGQEAEEIAAALGVQRRWVDHELFEARQKLRALPR